MWHVIICSAIIVIFISVAAVALKIGAEKTSTHKIVIHSECEANCNYIVREMGKVVALEPIEGNVIAVKFSADAKAGKMSEGTYEGLVALTAQLLEEYALEIEDVIRHKDASEGNCPEYFVQYEDAWEDFKIDVEEYKNTKR